MNFYRLLEFSCKLIVKSTSTYSFYCVAGLVSKLPGGPQNLALSRQKMKLNISKEGLFQEIQDILEIDKCKETVFIPQYSEAHSNYSLKLTKTIQRKRRRYINDNIKFGLHKMKVNLCTCPYLDCLLSTRPPMSVFYLEPEPLGRRAIIIALLHHREERKELSPPEMLAVRARAGGKSAPEPEMNNFTILCKLTTVTSRHLPAAPEVTETRTEDGDSCPESSNPEAKQDEEDDLGRGLFMTGTCSSYGCHSDKLTMRHSVRCAVKTEVVTLTALIMTTMTADRIQANWRPGNNECRVDSLICCPKIYTNVPARLYFPCCRKVAS